MSDDKVEISRSAKILIIDDREASRALLKRRLAMYGHEVFAAANSKDALGYLAKTPIDVLFLNMFINNQSSYSFLKNFKSNKRFKNVPVIMISGESDTEMLVKCIEAGAEDYLVRPLNQTILRARLSNCIARKEAYDKEMHYLSQIKEGKRQIAEQEKMASIGKLVSAISQELKNPLNFIINFADVSSAICNELIKKLEEQSAYASSQKLVLEQLDKFLKNIEKITTYGRSADQIIRFMLDQSNIDDTQKMMVGVGKVILQTIEMLVSSYKSRGIVNVPHIDVKVDDSIRMMLSVQSFSKAIYNLLDNSLFSVMQKYEDVSQAKIEVTAEKNQDDIEIYILDNGVGINPELSKKIFDPFFTTKSTGNNPGLGLSTTAAIFQNMKGDISVESEEGNFAKFKITLPISAE
ncbi:MAG: response regulator [Alphaproteobacteria bacterium]|nr:response regulator [Alphaproteobacteria bacterium]